MNTSKLQISPAIRPYRRRGVVTRASGNRPLKVVEAASGKAAIYGVILSNTNWVLTGVNPIRQLHDPGMAFVGVLACMLSAYTVLRSSELHALDDDAFDQSVLLKEGRTSMILFTLTMLSCFVQSYDIIVD
jgi:hypothetical protein